MEQAPDGGARRIAVRRLAPKLFVVLGLAYARRLLNIPHFAAISGDEILHVAPAVILRRWRDDDAGVLGIPAS
jgi:hypothetical protein